MDENTSTPVVTNEPTKLWNSSYIILIFISILSQSAAQMMNPILPSYLVKMGGTLTITAMVTTTLSLVALICRPFSGAATDFFNPKKIMLCTGLTTCICVLGYSLSPSIPIIMIFRVLHGIAFSIQSTTNIAFSTSFIPRDRLGEGMGYMAMCTILPTAVGPNIGIWVTDTISPNACLQVSAVLSAIAAIAILFVPYIYKKPERVEGGKYKLKMSDLIAKELLFLTFCIGMFSFGNGLINTYIKLLADKRHIPNVGLFFTASAIVLVAIRPISGRILDKKGLSFLLIPSYFITAVANCFVSYASATWMFVAAGILRAIGQGSGAPSIQATAIKSLGKDRRGVAVSTCFIGQDLGQVIGPILGSYVATKFDYTTMFNSYGVLLILTAVFYILYSRFSKNEVVRSSLI